MLWIVAGLVAWGVYLAVGDYLSNQNPLRSLVILACVAIFLAFWGTALAVRHLRRASGRDTDTE
jgi:drug/metabolite transporter (DMT)-like permease